MKKVELGGTLKGLGFDVEFWRLVGFSTLGHCKRLEGCFIWNETFKQTQIVHNFIYFYRFF